MESLRSKISLSLKQEPQLLPSEMAEKFGISELEILQEFPKDTVTIVDGSHAEMLLTEIAGWKTNVTSIMQLGGSIFEVKAILPVGKKSMGYFNLMGQPGQLQGHLKLENISKVCFVSKPFMGKESHYFGFIDNNGNTIFKIYLGRDEQRRLLLPQIKAFKELKEKLAN
ncbi:heme utilization cystosolic carrier protein HutX [Vibrio salinus]|uniref:heme utilization cystosolic carrier protein HutX n=1 Tax=Vibrio salinus TaxID=2899784 RepID=UPI001E5F174E|nr:heme utilization cystosolic carrier protein HutX [Vibrio salinus]MCE0495927.1 heme utilization cystosolic carrier protein HutX [Vibrio salinus]